MVPIPNLLAVARGIVIEITNPDGAKPSVVAESSGNGRIGYDIDTSKKLNAIVIGSIFGFFIFLILIGLSLMLKSCMKNYTDIRDAQVAAQIARASESVRIYQAVVDAFERGIHELRNWADGVQEEDGTPLPRYAAGEEPPSYELTVMNPVNEVDLWSTDERVQPREAHILADPPPLYEQMARV